MELLTQIGMSIVGVAFIVVGIFIILGQWIG